MEILSTYWGFLVGFVCWGSLFRLIEPVSDWLVERKNGCRPSGVSRLIVCLFFITLVFFILTWMPIFYMATKMTTYTMSKIDREEWRFCFSITFISSLMGLVTFGCVHSLRRRKQGR